LDFIDDDDDEFDLVEGLCIVTAAAAAATFCIADEERSTLKEALVIFAE
jgi:hypothetical protein